MSDDTAMNLGKWAFSILLVLYFGFYGIYFGFYELVNKVDTSIYDRYATD